MSMLEKAQMVQDGLEQRAYIRPQSVSRPNTLFGLEFTMECGVMSDVEARIVIYLTLCNHRSYHKMFISEAALSVLCAYCISLLFFFHYLVVLYRCYHL